MAKEYRFSLTPRLIGLLVLCLSSLMVLLFLLGIQLGQHMVRPATASDTQASPPFSTPSPPSALANPSAAAAAARSPSQALESWGETQVKGHTPVLPAVLSPVAGETASYPKP
jgi:hypothetical protein